MFVNSNSTILIREQSVISENTVLSDDEQNSSLYSDIGSNGITVYKKKLQEMKFFLFYQLIFIN